VWIPGGGSVETYDFSLLNDYSFSYLSFFGHKYAKKVMGPFWERADALGKDRNPYRAGYAQFICVSETDAQAQIDYEEHVKYFFAKCMHIDPRFFEAPGYRTVASLRAGLRSQLDGTAKVGKAILDEGFGWKELVESGYIIAGSPETVREQIVEAARELHVGNLIWLFHCGSMPQHLSLKNLHLFAEGVLPHIRNLWPQWDHRPFWPSGFGDPTPDTRRSAA
jgi:alkanesulfonate monooxygenase SsuD/methylene tetrahydromethanopterin reductase-like flavin-dependent oxidoreductase (luciferase family)